MPGEVGLRRQPASEGAPVAAFISPLSPDSPCPPAQGNISSSLSKAQTRSAPLLNSNIDLSFRYTEPDYIRAFRAHFISPLRLRLDIAIIIVFGGLGLCLRRWSDASGLGLTLVILAGVLAFVLVAGLAIIPMFIFRHELKFRDEYSFTFSPEGIHIRTMHLDSQVQWGMYPRALIDAHSYILYFGRSQFTPIPKRVFQDTGQQQAFEQLLTKHILEIVRRD